MRKLLLISAFVAASVLASLPVQAQNLGAGNALESAGPDGAMAKPEGAGKPASRSSKSHAVRRESDEQKARRIAAKYGVSW
jgi:hypothetical protein